MNEYTMVVLIVSVALIAGIINNYVNRSYKLKLAKIENGIIDDDISECKTQTERPQSEEIISDDPIRFTFGNIVIFALMGVGISALISLGFSIAFNEFSPAPLPAIEQWGMIGAAAASYAAGAIFCIVGYTSADIFRIQSWPMWVRTLVHFVCLYLTFLVCSYLAQWVNYSNPSMVIQANVIFVLIYLFIFIMKSIQYKKQTEMMNRKLNQIQND